MMGVAYFIQLIPDGEKHKAHAQLKRERAPGKPLAGDCARLW